MAMNFSLSDAEELAPKRLRQMIVRDLDQMNTQNAFIAGDLFPLMQVGSSTEIYHRIDGARLPMPGAALDSESPTRGLEELTEDEITVETFKEKISPEKGADPELNSQRELVNFAEYVADSLRMDLLHSRELLTFRSYNGIEGMVGTHGADAHSSMDTDHVLTPSTAFSDTTNSDPHDEFMSAEEEVDIDGSGFDQLTETTAVVPTSVLYDLMRNENLEGDFSGVRPQVINTAERLNQVLPVDNIREVRTKVPRMNADGEPIDANGDVVSDPRDAEMDNILEPYDPGAGSVNRNVLIGTFGQQAAAMPWLTDRLADHLDSTPSGEFSVDTNNGYLIQQWTLNDPAISFRKIAQETGFELVRPDNFAIIQDI